MNIDAKILNEKIELIQWLSSLDDKIILDKNSQFTKKETKDWWNTISNEEKISIEKGIEDADNKKLNDHTYVRKLYEKWL